MGLPNLNPNANGPWPIQITVALSDVTLPRVHVLFVILAAEVVTDFREPVDERIRAPAHVQAKGAEIIASATTGIYIASIPPAAM